jgi:glucose/arabinose dehydrogenase
MAHDKHGVLWAADTGADNLQRQDLGGDITNDNPAEELLKLPEDLMGTHFGYPYCWTEYRLDEPYALGRGTAWAWPATFNITVTDDDCRTKYGQASVAMQAHSTPLGITFYNYKPPEEIPDYCPGGAFPESMDGYVCKYLQYRLLSSMNLLMLKTLVSFHSFTSQSLHFTARGIATFRPATN